MTLGNFLKNKRMQAGFSLRQLSYKIGLSHTNIADVEKGIVNKRETIEKIMNALSFSEEEKKEAFKLLDFQKVPESIKKELEELKKAVNEKGNAKILDVGIIDLPVYGTASAGNGYLNLDNVIYSKKVIRDGFSKDSFLVEICGNSMEPKIKEGDWVLVDPQENDYIAGKVYVVTYNGETYIKRIEQPNSDLVILKSYNPDYDDIYISGESISDLTIEGRVLKVIKEEVL